MATALGRAVRSLASSSQSGDINHVTLFLETIIVRSLSTQLSCMLEVDGEPSGFCKAPTAANISKSLPGSAHKTINSLLTVLAAMAIIPIRQGIQGDNDQQDSSKIADALLKRLATSVMLECIQEKREEYRDNKPRLTAITQLRILASAIIMACEECRIATETGTTSIKVNDLITGIISISNRCDIECRPQEQIASFVCDLALCCGQSLDFDAQKILEGFVMNMTRRAETETHSAQTFLWQVALAVSYTHLTLPTKRIV